MPSHDEETSTPGSNAVRVLRVVGGPRTLTRPQRKFNMLVERLSGQRNELAAWHAFTRHYQQQLAERYQPLAVRLRERRIALLELFDRALQRETLSKRDREKLRDLLLRSVAELLEESAETALVALHDKYADATYAEGRREELAVLRTLAEEEFGLDVGAYAGAETPEDLADWLKEQIRAGRPEADPAAGAKKNAGGGEHGARRAQAAEGGTRAVREVFRKLASELHPDRETDPAEQLRKTALMQQVNQAYKAGDLLALLELQLSIEQIDSDAILGLAEERLKHYIFVLEEQSRRLRDELTEVVEPFVRVVGEATSRTVTADAVQRALDSDIRALKELVRSVDAELLQFRDLRQLKQSLGQYRINSPDEDTPRPRARRR